EPIQAWANLLRPHRISKCVVWESPASHNQEPLALYHISVPIITLEAIMAKLLGPDFIALQVRSLETSAKFYVERLGLTRSAGGPPNAIVFDTKPVPFALREPLVDLDATSKLGWGMVLWMACDDA